MNIKYKIKQIIRFIVLWAFKEYITSIGIDYHINSPSWCVINIKGNLEDRVAFIQLKHNITVNEINTLIKYINQYSYVNVDCNRNFKQYFV